MMSNKHADYFDTSSTVTVYDRQPTNTSVGDIWMVDNSIYCHTEDGPSVISTYIKIDEEPRFSIDIDAIENLDDVKAILKLAFLPMLTLEQVKGIEHLVSADSKDFEPQEVVKLRGQGVKFRE